MREIRYPAYRRYEAQRIEANNSTMALLAGAQLASHSLTLTAGSELLLPEIFPNVPHITRFNLRTEVATAILADAEPHLAAMSIPYVLAIHEDYMKSSALEMMADCHRIGQRRFKEAQSYNVHEEFMAASNRSIDPHALELFHLQRLVRNCVVHAGGLVDPRLEAHCRSLSTKARNLWERMTRTSCPAFVRGNELALRHNEIIGTLALVKRLARDVNWCLGQAYPREKWGRVVVQDAKDHAGRDLGNPAQLIRHIVGVARHHYKPLGLTEGELRSAAQKEGLV